MQKNLEKEYNGYNLEGNFRIYLSAVKKIKAISIKNYLSDLRYFIGWLQHNNIPYSSLEQDFELITEEIVQAYAEYLIQNEFPPKTINRRLSTVRTLCDFLLSQSLIKVNPSKNLRNYYPTKKEEQSKIAFDYEPFRENLKSSGMSDEESQQIIGDVSEFLEVIGQSNI